MEKEKDFKNPQYYENRELSWLKFDNRVLNEARDKSCLLYTSPSPRDTR